MSVSDERKVLEVSTPQCEEGPDGQNETFHGPLISAGIQKEDVMRLIQGKCQDCLLHVDDPDQQKSYFFWLMMELLCNKNGKVMMAEIGALLFKGYGHVRRQPSHVKDQEDWCLPLATLLCSTAEACELRTAIIELGDKFDSIGLFYAAHTCYLVAQLDLGSRMHFQLIGSEKFMNYGLVPVEALERTEVYEYMRSLTSGIGQPCFQKFKYLHACNLSDAGHSAQALEYCENMARNIWKIPRFVSSSIVGQVIKLSENLLNGREEPPEWLLKLCRLRNVFISVHSTFSDEPEQSSSGSEEFLEFQEELQSRYIVKELLGKGVFGYVYSGTRKDDGKQVAMKYVAKVPRYTFPGEKPLEVELTETVSKPPRCENVVELLEWFDFSTSFVMVLERPMPCMTLERFFETKKENEMPEWVIREIFQQVFQAIRHCFMRGVLHGDMQAHNILINPDTLEVKLIDFGCGEFMSDKNERRAGLSTYVRNLGLLLADMICGELCVYSYNYILEMCSTLVSKGVIGKIMSVSDARKVLEVSTPQCEEGPDRQNETVHGPLISVGIQKEDVIRFIQGKCQDCLLHVDDPDQQKSYFFWLMMELLCNKNGKVMMAEIGALLFKGYGHVRRQPGHVKDQEDWCLPLATLLCATAEACELRTAIIELGDKFDSIGLFYAAHTCYVVAQVDLGSRMHFQLIGSEKFMNYGLVPVEALERTEVYEYMRSLTSGIGQPCFQKFKYLHACNLADAGHSAQALEYCENMARNIWKTPRFVSSSIVGQVIKLSENLLNGREEPPEWMLKLCRLRNMFISVHSTFSDEPEQSSSRSEKFLEFQEELQSHYIVGELLGKGFFGCVYAGVRKADGKPVAMKYVAKVPRYTFPREKPLEVELTETVSKPPRCENVVELLEWFDFSTCFVMVLERPMPCMTLARFLETKKDEMSEWVVREIFRQVFQAVRHCFMRGVLHSDMQAHNILINPVTLEVKLIDFGCGEFLSDENERRAGLSTYIGNLGLLLANMICGAIYFYTYNYILEMCLNLVSKECCHLLSCCLNSQDDLNFDDILNHVWFTMELQDTIQALGLELNGHDYTRLRCVCEGSHSSSYKLNSL